ncbi:MAG TPA: hypothetical protein VEL76_42690 [Gemmataceae bacterium]|nr:hypothetical protein [Gemmataceae bacterium]
MASLLFKDDSYYCQFYYLGRRFTVTIGEISKDEAEDFAGSVGQLLRRIKQKLIRVPAGVSITTLSSPAARSRLSKRLLPRLSLRRSLTSRRSLSTPTASGRWRQTRWAPSAGI